MLELLDRPGLEQASFWANDLSSLNRSCLTCKALIISPPPTDVRMKRYVCVAPSEHSMVYTVFYNYPHKASDAVSLEQRVKQGMSEEET